MTLRIFKVNKRKLYTLVKHRIILMDHTMAHTIERSHEYTIRAMINDNMTIAASLALALSRLGNIILMLSLDQEMRHCHEI